MTLRNDVDKNVHLTPYNSSDDDDDDDDDDNDCCDDDDNINNNNSKNSYSYDINRSFRVIIDSIVNLRRYAVTILYSTFIYYIFFLSLHIHVQMDHLAFLCRRHSIVEAEVGLICECVFFFSPHHTRDTIPPPPQYIIPRTPPP